MEATILLVEQERRLRDILGEGTSCSFVIGLWKWDIWPGQREGENVFEKHE